MSFGLKSSGKLDYQILSWMEGDGIDGTSVTGVDGEAFAGIDAPDSRSLVSWRRSHQGMTQFGHTDVPNSITVTLILIE